MTNCTKYPIIFPSIKNKKIVGNFKGGEVTSDGGMLLLRSIDKKIGLTKSIAKHIPDNRNPQYITHSIRDMLRQRVYGIATGYEDLNDHDLLRNDLIVQISVDRSTPLASSPTLCRFENNMTQKALIGIHEEILSVFTKSFKAPPKELILDFDATDLPTYGKQQGKAYHGYYEHDCFLPLHVFCGKQLLVSYLRKSNQDGAKHAWAILALLTKYFRSKWPNVKIIFRADSGFCRQKILNWCDKNQVKYIVGIACNSRLKKSLEPYLEEAKNKFDSTKTIQFFTQFNYKAHSWQTVRKVIGKTEYTSKGGNIRTIVTNMDGSPEELYKKQYCARGEMENRIKEQFLLFSYRTSAHRWWANQLRLLLSGLAYILLERLQTNYLKGTILAIAQVDTIRLKLLKIGAVITKNTRRIILFFSSHYVHQDLFVRIVALLNTS